MKKAQLGLLVVALFYSLSGAAQIGSFKNIIPPSPNAASLGKYGDIPVSYYTGIPNINIPLYTIQAGGISLPISASYHAGGVRVSEDAGWIGLNWTLNYGGMISRVVKEIDDFKPNGFANANPYPVPTGESSNFIGPGTCYVYKTPADYIIGRKTDYSHLNSNDINAPKYDYTPDVFYFNFLNYSGKFILDSIGRAVVLDPQRISVEFSALKDIITVKTEDGTKFIFGPKGEATIVTYTAPPIETDRTAWYLTKIQTTDGKEITFEYNSPIHEVEQTLYNHFRTLSGCGRNVPPSTTIYNKLTHQASAITKIVFPEGYIDFKGSYLREDLKDAFQLDSIQIYSKSGTLLKQFNFGYDYFIAQAQEPQFQYSRDYSPKNDPLKRLKLVQINEKGKNNALNPPYRFSYNEAKLPPKTSFSQDHWGYYNGKLNQSLIPKYDGIFNEKDELIHNYGTSSRDPDSAFAKAGVLDTIFYPTGGYSSFKLESNDYKVSPYYNLASGPTYVAKDVLEYGKTRTTTNNVPVIITTADNPYVVIVSMTVVCAGPVSGGTSCGGVSATSFVVALKKGTEVIATYNLSNGSTTIIKKILSPGTYTLSAAIPDGYYGMAQITVTPFKNSGTPISKKICGGLRVKRIIDYDGMNHQKDIVKNFSYGPIDNTGKVTESSGLLHVKPRYEAQFVHYYLDELSATVMPCVVTDFTSNPVYSLTGEGQGHFVGYGNVTTSVGNGISNGYSEFHFYSDTATLFLPLPNSPIFFKPLNGKLKEKYDYSPTGKRLKEEKYDYATSIINNVWAMFSVFERVPSGKQVDPECRGMSSHFIYKNPVTWVKQTGVYEKTYSLENTKFVENSTLYQYEAKPIHYNPFKVTKSKSDGSKLNTLTLYPSDYPLGVTSIRNLVNAHIYNVPIETVSYEESGTGNLGKIISGQFNSYDENSGFLLESFNYQPATPQPVSNFKFSNQLNKGTLPTGVLGSGFGRDGAYLSRIKVDYNASKNLKQISKDQISNTSYIWGYGELLPIAEASNALNTNIAFANFESSTDPGGWTISNTSLINPSDSKTGKFCFTGNLSKSSLSSATYVVSLWAKPIGSGGTLTIGGVPAKTVTGSSWSYYEWEIPSTTSVSLTNSGCKIDDVRLYPKGALMTTYTYEPILGISSITDANNSTVYYEYDAFGRLDLIKDHNKNILKKYNYQYKY